MQSTLSHRAELFRSKLIEDFQLLETMTEQGRKRAPVYNSSDVLGRRMQNSWKQILKKGEKTKIFIELSINDIQRVSNAH